MKKGILIFLLFSGTGSFAQTSVVRNGWEFIPWLTKQSTVDSLLARKGIVPQKQEALGEYQAYAQFVYQDLRTRIYFDKKDCFCKVSQHKDFSVASEEKSKACFETTKKYLLETYGKPAIEKNEKEKELITIGWNQEFMIITLTYDHKYKVVDEMGCCSFNVDVEFEPIKNK